MQFSSDQIEAVKRFQTWKRSTSREFRLGGLAGTGKTTLVKDILKELGANCEAFAPTARAAFILTRKGVRADTLHSLLMRFEHETIDDRGRTIPVFSDKSVHRKLILVDESSMVGRSMYEKILRAADRIIWVGDYGQLPPVEDDGSGFCVLDESQLDAKLSTIHRQDEQSSIIDFSQHLRMGGLPTDFSSDESVMVNPTGVDGRNMVAWIHDHKADTIIVYTNDFRARINIASRRLFGMPDHGLCAGLRIVCVKNSYDHRVANGELFEIKEVDGNTIITTCDRRFPVTFDKRKPGVLIEDGFAITCHKAQGSEFDRVCVIEDMPASPQWRYTAATRAKGMLTYFQKP